MKKKVISMLLLSILILSGCSSSKATENKNLVDNKTASSSDSIKTTENTSTQSNAAGQANDKGTTKNVPKLNSVQKEKVNSNVTAVVSSVKTILNSIEEAQDINLNE